jgi:hypothetical protein
MIIRILFLFLLSVSALDICYGSNKCSELFKTENSTQSIGEYFPQLIRLPKPQVDTYLIEINEFKVHEPYLKAPYPRGSFSIGYIVSNEALYTVYKDVLENNQRGGFVGVGAEQNYTLAAMQNAEHIFLVDTNPLVSEIHQLNSIFFEIAKTPHEFLDLYNEINRTQVINWLKESHLEDLAELYSELQYELYESYFNHTFKGRREFIKPGSFTAKMGFAGDSFLNDISMFNYMKKMFAEHKVSIYLGDYSRTNLLEHIAHKSKNLNLGVRAFYVSNSLDNMYVSFSNPYLISGLASLLLVSENDVLILNTYSSSRRYFNSNANVSSSLPPPLMQFQGDLPTYNWIYSVDQLSGVIDLIQEQQKGIDATRK